MASVKRVLDSPTMTRALQVAAALSLLLAIVIGVKQYSLASCLAKYQEDSARSTAARAAAAAEDRKADEADRQAAEAERQAFLALIVTIGGPDRQATARAFVSLQSAYKAGADKRAETARTRAENEKKRRENPPPDPPSLRCG